ncbi:MAG: DUF2202 domain-containing protein [Opitutae bacterium]|nr:DUF2202 domain-containing protein [Opitutae bacterium]
MKTPILLLSSLAFVATATAQPCRGGNRGACDRPARVACGATSTAPLQLSAAARDALLFQIEEERMAREIYAALEAKWSLPQFRHIQRAEQRHEDALRALATRASLTPPAAVAGKFAAAVVQQRYDELLARGLRSADEALAAGAAVERQDLADLQALVACTDSEELRNVARSLAGASERHLAAFEGRPGGAGGRNQACAGTRRRS